jgi:hypothetical protein
LVDLCQSRAALQHNLWRCIAPFSCRKIYTHRGLAPRIHYPGTLAVANRASPEEKMRFAKRKPDEIDGKQFQAKGRKATNRFTSNL